MNGLQLAHAIRESDSTIGILLLTGFDFCPMELPACIDSVIEKPVGIAAFPIDLIPFPPRSMVERTYNVAHWTDFKSGGHFAALERPDELVGDIRKFAASL